MMLSVQVGCASLGGTPDEEPDENQSSDESLFASFPFISTGDATPELEIRGIEDALLSNVRTHLSLGRDACNTPLWRIHRHYGEALNDIKPALQALGYYRPVVEKRLILPCPTVESGDATKQETAPEGCKKDCWSAQFTIDPGEPVLVTAIEVMVQGEAQDDPAFHALREALPIRKGDVLNHEHYERIKNDITALAESLGYLDGHFTAHALRVDPENLQAMIHIAYDSGPRYRFGKAHIHHESLDDGIIEGIIDWREGDFFDTKKLTRMHRELVDSDYFAAVEVRPRFREERDHRVPVDINLVPRKRYRFSAGLGLTTDSGPSGSLGVLNRRINSRGHRWSADTAISLVESKLTTEYRIPLADPRTDWLSFQAGYRKEDTNTAKSQGIRLGARRTRRYANDWLGTISLDALQENFSTGATTEGISTLMVAGAGFSHSNYEHRMRPRWGHRVDLKLNLSNAMFGSDSNFVQGHVSGKWVRGMSWGGRFILRGELGASAVDDFNELPVSYRFFAGGDKSVRGYGFHELGPKDGQGDIIGGPHIVVGSLEYEHPVAERWAITTFVDHGNALNSSANMFGSALKTGVGAGVRWFSPFGPAGVDLAFPVGEDASTFRVHLSVGIDL